MYSLTLLEMYLKFYNTKYIAFTHNENLNRTHDNQEENNYFKTVSLQAKYAQQKESTRIEM